MCGHWKGSDPNIFKFKKLMGSKIDCYSSDKSSFSYDLKVAFEQEDHEKNGSIHYNYEDKNFFMEDLPGISVFSPKDDRVYHKYFVCSRGLDPLITIYHQFLDLVPKRRIEGDSNPKMSWARRHNEYC
jgi:predicted dithiol-disulfide oxidoreductase (DUF899 family)